MNAATLPADVIELVCDHLSLEADELIVESSTSDVAAISGHWNECSRDLGHLSREERVNVLQRRSEFRPAMIGDIAVTLYNDVQVLKGKPCVSAAIIDDGEGRYIVMGF